MRLHIKTDTDGIYELYKNHTHFHPGDSGIDLFIIEDHNIEPNKLDYKINLGISCEAFNDNTKEHTSYYLYPRSSISNTALRMSNSVGVIDSGYRGNIIAAVDNLSNEQVLITTGTRLFQICDPSLNPIKIELVNSLSDTSRGQGGFGSTN